MICCGGGGLRGQAAGFAGGGVNFYLDSGSTGACGLLRPLLTNNV